MGGVGKDMLSEIEIAKVAQYAARAPSLGGGVAGEVFLPALMDLMDSFFCAIFSCLLTTEVKIFLGWFSFARPAPFNIKMKTKSLLSPKVEKSELLIQNTTECKCCSLAIMSSTLVKRKERERQGRK